MKASLMLMAMVMVSGVAQAGTVCQAQSGAQVTPLLELYTSEGCSSCPPADRWFGRLVKSTKPSELSLLAFHVDYWNSIGWPDRFSSAAYTRRQGDRVRAGGSSTVYTPQLMLASQLNLRWNNEAAVQAALSEQHRRAASVALHLQAVAAGANWQVNLQAAPSHGAVAGDKLWLALFEDGVSTRVRAGENAGAFLQHERVVRRLWGPWDVAGKDLGHGVVVTPPKDAKASNLGLTAFVQNSRSGDTAQSLSLSLANCAAPGS